uniref:GBD/FH3 domain-containing protein n=1 Tax=Rhabditophanes sp. KR3021 TaxID=114890 RepID=A0AC35UB82_9BILA
MSEPERLPKNLQNARSIKDLLTQTTSLHSGLKQPNPLTEENKKFISEALGNAMSNNDPMVHVKNYAYQLMDADMLHEVATIMDCLCDYICQIDCAVAFCKFGGLKIIENKFKELDFDECHLLLYQLISSLNLNNPQVQNMEENIAFLERGIQMLLAHNTDTQHEVKRRCVVALSSIITNNSTNTRYFLEHGGCDAFVATMKDALYKDEKPLLERAMWVTHKLIETTKEYNEFIGDSRIQRLSDSFNEIILMREHRSAPEGSSKKIMYDGAERFTDDERDEMTGNAKIIRIDKSEESVVARLEALKAMGEEGSSDKKEEYIYRSKKKNGENTSSSQGGCCKKAGDESADETIFKVPTTPAKKATSPTSKPNQDSS